MSGDAERGLDAEGALAVKVEADRHVREFEVASEFALTPHPLLGHICLECLSGLLLAHYHLLLSKYFTTTLVKVKVYFTFQQTIFILPHLVAYE